MADASWEADLLELSLHAAASQVEGIVRAWRRAEDDDTEALAAAKEVGGERMDLRHVVGVLMTNRELTRLLAEQNGLDRAA